MIGSYVLSFQVYLALPLQARDLFPRNDSVVTAIQRPCVPESSVQELKSVDTVFRGFEKERGVDIAQVRVEVDRWVNEVKSQMRDEDVEGWDDVHGGSCRQDWLGKPARRRLDT